MDFYRARSLAVNTGAYLFCIALTFTGAVFLPRVLPSPRSLENTVQDGSNQDTFPTAGHAAEAFVGGCAGLTISMALCALAMGYLEKRRYIGRRR